MHQKDTDVPVDIKAFPVEDEGEKEISYLEANVSIIEPDFEMGVKKNCNKEDIILCISNLDIKDLDDGTTQSEHKLVKKFSIPNTGQRLSLDVEKVSKEVNNTKNKKIIFAIVTLLILLIIGIVLYFILINSKN
jgi:hypothetical protein